VSALAIAGSTLEVRARNPRPAEAEIGEVEAIAKKRRARRRCPQAQPDRVRADRRTGAAAARGNAEAAFENNALRHERGISPRRSSVILPDSFITWIMLRRSRIVAGWWCIPSGCGKNLDRSRGAGVLGHGAAGAARRGVSREEACEWVQQNAMRPFTKPGFQTLLLADADVTGVPKPAEIERAFDRAAAAASMDLRSRVWSRGQRRGLTAEKD
jgi:hypothetical protein